MKLSSKGFLSRRERPDHLDWYNNGFIKGRSFCETDVLPFSGHLYVSFVFQTHLETSIARHKAHIKKCELLLRLLDNDELSPEQVNDVKDFLEDYVERNQVCFLNLNSYYL